MFRQLAHNTAEIDLQTCIDVDKGSETERSVGSQVHEGGDQLISALISIEMPVMTFARREALGRHRGRADTMNLDDFSRQGR